MSTAWIGIELSNDMAAVHFKIIYYANLLYVIIIAQLMTKYGHKVLITLNKL